MSNHTIDYVWRDYDPRTMQYVENWLDEETVKTTGLDEGFRVFYEQWANEDGFVVGENFWCKVVYENCTPIAVIAFCQHKDTMLVMEFVVAPQKRGRGIGTTLLKEFLGNEEIVGFVIPKSEAVIFPHNIASQKAFENAGYQHHHTYEDGTAMYYVYESSSES